MPMPATLVEAHGWSAAQYRFGSVSSNGWRRLPRSAPSAYQTSRPFW
ncbi:MAG TPA: hypothetical protein VFJ94_01005 [Intrasporangium sp.]|nr:hypothetical protein [Intrasporangium sp.]HET7397069.1 hypothetical protein [Intrasporangium sp.]